MMDYEIQKSTAMKQGAMVDQYDVCIGGEWTEGSLTLDELAALRDFITEYINREMKYHNEPSK